MKNLNTFIIYFALLGCGGEADRPGDLNPGETSAEEGRASKLAELNRLANKQCKKNAACGTEVDCDAESEPDAKDIAVALACYQQELALFE